MTTTALIQSTTPGIEWVTFLDDDPELSPASKTEYIRAAKRYLKTGGNPLDADALATYAASLTDSQKGTLRSAVVRYIQYQQQAMNGLADPTAEDPRILEARMAQADRRFDALRNAIRVKAPKGQKAHNWLTPKQVREMYAAIGGGIEGERDKVALGLLVGAGLRREEAVNLTFDDVKLQPVDGKLRTVLSVCGKGKKNRVVPISDHLANLIDDWGKRLGHAGRIIRSLGRNREPGESISGVALFKLVRRYGARIGLPELAAHDLRRTYAQIGYEAGVPITQISRLLGHASVATTQRYLNLDLDLKTTASDFVPWG